MKQKLGFLILLFAIALLIVGCSDANDQFIQGAWYYKDPHLNSIAGETYLEIEWAFDRGTFEYRACCFNVDAHWAGRYRIVESEGDVLTLEFFNIRGGPSGRIEVRFVIDREEDILAIQGARFTRVLSISR